MCNCACPLVYSVWCHGGNSWRTRSSIWTPPSNWPDFLHQSDWLLVLHALPPAEATSGCCIKRVMERSTLPLFRSPWTSRDSGLNTGMVLWWEVHLCANMFQVSENVLLKEGCALIWGFTILFTARAAHWYNGSASLPYRHFLPVCWKPESIQMWG